MKGDVRVWQLTSQKERRRESEAERQRGRESKVMRSLFWPLPQGLLICVVVMCSRIQRPFLFVYVGTPCVCMCVYVMDVTQNYHSKSHLLNLPRQTNDREKDATR